MRPYAEVIGDPIAHSKSPALHRHWLDHFAIDGEYRAMRVRPDELDDYFEARRRDEWWRGCNITMPHKLAALAHAPHRTDPSFPVEAISLAVRKPDGQLEGLAFDAYAIVQSLLMSTLRFAGQSGPAVILGAGGAAGAAAWALAHFGCAPIWVRNRDQARADAFAAERTGIAVRTLPIGEPIPPARILINATPMGLSGRHDPAIVLDFLGDDGIVYDMIYDPLETQLLRRARDRGLATFDGLDMLIPGAAMSFGKLYGQQVLPAMWPAARAAILVP